MCVCVCVCVCLCVCLCVCVCVCVEEGREYWIIWKNVACYTGRLYKQDYSFCLYQKFHTNIVLWSSESFILTEMLLLNFFGNRKNSPRFTKTWSYTKKRKQQPLKFLRNIKRSYTALDFLLWKLVCAINSQTVDSWK